MRKYVGVLCFLCLLAISSLALASGATIRTYTPFADQDPAAQQYNDLMESWSSETGNAIEDFSGTMDEAYMEALGEALRAGEADIVVLPVGSGVDTSLLIDVNTLLAAAPDSGIRIMDVLREDSGTFLTPVRFN